METKKADYTMKYLKESYLTGLLLVIGFNSYCQPPQIKYTTCEIARELAKEELKADTTTYYQFGDFSVNSAFYQKIDSLARSMKIKIVSTSHHKSLECYNDIVLDYFKKEKGIENIWYYLNSKTDSLMHEKKY